MSGLEDEDVEDLADDVEEDQPVRKRKAAALVSS
jgi:hypothetical protein